jgi:acyl-coenzyme A thioesterase PaaI-like protein
MNREIHVRLCERLGAKFPGPTRRLTVGYVECTITDEENRLVAKAASTCMALRGQKTEGR